MRLFSRIFHREYSKIIFLMGFHFDSKAIEGVDLRCQENSLGDSLIKVAQRASSEKPQFLQTTAKTEAVP